MTSPKHKKPSFNQQFVDAKTAKISPRANPDRFLDRSPSWRIARLELCDPFGWHACSETEFRTIHERLKAFETMTWKDILNAPNARNHFIQVSALGKPARDRVEALGLDVDELMSLRVSQKQRIFGVMVEEVCQLLFWDPEHQVYPMNIADN